MTTPEQTPVTPPPPPGPEGHQPLPPLHREDPRRRSPVVAAILSLLPGLGQVYVGYYQLGFIYAVTIGTLIAVLENELVEPLTPLVAVFMIFFWIFNMIDATRRAVLYNEALAGREGIEPPRDMQAGVRGSVAGGSVLVVLGLLLLGHNLLDISLDWLEDWWPAALVAFGAWLIYRARAEHGPETPPYLRNDEES